MRTKDTFLAFLYHFFFVCDSFICVRRIFPEVPEDPALQEKGNELLHQHKQEGEIFAFAENGLEALYKDSKYSSHGVIEEFAKLNNLDGATVKVWFNNKLQRDTGEPSEP